MNKLLVLGFCAAATMLQGATTAQACGDKLSVIGGGVSFDRVSQHHGNVVMLVEPNSSLRAANDDLKLRKALEYAGNKVRTVENPADLKGVLEQGHTDVVLVSWGDSGKLQEQLAGRSPAPTVLPVAYRTDPAELLAASRKGTCFALAKQDQGKQFVQTVGRVLEQREKKVPVVCSPVAMASTS
jgi:DNA-binding NtrC family response regulator